MLCEMASIGNGWCQCRHCPNRAKAEHPEKVFAQCRAGATEKQPGAGTHLKQLLGKLGLTQAAGCGCGSHAATMDRMGPDWCEEHIDTIVGWLREGATNRKLPFVEWAARQMVKMAIRRARETSLGH